MTAVLVSLPSLALQTVRVGLVALISYDRTERKFNHLYQSILNDTDSYFDDIWYPDADDIDVFDDTVTWILSVAHSGQNKLLKL